MKKELVLYISKKFADSLELTSTAKRAGILEKLDQHPEQIGFASRALIENDPSKLQLIPYVVIKMGQRVLCYERAGSEGRLHGQKSIGVGGHINLNDVELSGLEDEEGVIIPSGTLERGLLRELDEEVVIRGMFQAPQLIGTVFPTKGKAVDKVHLGLVYLLCLGEDSVDLAETARRLKNAMDLDQKDLNGLDLELWSKDILGFI